jgi:hypothetical protein
VVTSAVLEAEKSLGHAADEIYLVTTSFTPWQVHFLQVDEVVRPGLASSTSHPLHLAVLRA